MPQFSMDWPTSYNPGPPEHLHALGVISMNIGSFENTLDALYFESTKLNGLPLAALQYHYYRLDEEKRLREIRNYFSTSGRDIKAVNQVHNLLQYFQWGRDCRNHLLHATLYPPGLAGMSGRIYLA